VISINSVLGRPFVKRFALCYRTVVCPVCPVCLSVRDVGVLWPNGRVDQDETWRGGRLRPRPHCVRWGPSTPSPKGHSPPIFGPCLLWPNGWMIQDATWYGGRPRPKQHCVRWGPIRPQKRWQSPQFSAHVYCGQTARSIKVPLRTEVDSAQATLC